MGEWHMRQAMTTLPFKKYAQLFNMNYSIGLTASFKRTNSKLTALITHVSDLNN